ncbi:hypothetical protein M9H77_07000 [Catharanthus roseus]|uniref:Uncharacterized protein n=1 Tax=Catharanthus roseus TaxID=4058 RepID=A0ACC0BTU8_CATRO|nr:hypothetical protein M9H77_07000 [Catharanthus roseus]
MCIIAFGGNLFLLVPSMTNFLSSHFPIEDPLMSNSAMFDPSCYGFDNSDDTSLNLHQNFLFYHLPFKDLFWRHDLAKEQCFGNIHSIVPFNASISNVSHLLWLFEGLDSKTNPFKGGADGMTWDRHENIESFQGSVTRSRVRKMEEET